MFSDRQHRWVSALSVLSLLVQHMSISPELALAAAAAIGDKALQDLTKELLELKRQLAESRKVEITGSGGFPVYASGHFEDGKCRNRNELVGDRAISISFSRSSWWDVPVTMCEGYAGIFLNDLQHLEIRLGGIVYAATRSANEEVQGCDVRILDNDSINGLRRTCRLMIIPIQSGGGSRNATIQIDLRDMPEPPWKMLKSAISYNRTECNIDALIDVFDMMTSSRELPMRLPNQVADIISISFDTNSVEPLLLRLTDQRKLT